MGWRSKAHSVYLSFMDVAWSQSVDLDLSEREKEEDKWFGGGHVPLAETLLLHQTETKHSYVCVREKMCVSVVSWGKRMYSVSLYSCRSPSVCLKRCNGWYHVSQKKHENLGQFNMQFIQLYLKCFGWSRVFFFTLLRKCTSRSYACIIDGCTF